MLDNLVPERNMCIEKTEEKRTTTSSSFCTINNCPNIKFLLVIADKENWMLPLGYAMGF